MEPDTPQTGIPLPEQAAHWWAVLNGEGAGAAERRAFGEWIVRSPERVEAYLRVVRLMGALRGPDARWPDVPAAVLIHEARSAPAGVARLEQRIARVDGDPGAGRSGRRSRGFRNRLLAMAAATLAAVTVAGWVLFGGPQGYATAVGEQRSVLLDDGSLVTLNTSSRIEVSLDPQRRTVRLLQGEALFDVAKDTSRPFEVLAGPAAIRAVGTQFNVDRRVAHTTVTVLEGRVLVGAATGPDGGLAEVSGAQGSYLAAAERIVVTEAGRGMPEQIANVAPVTAWTQRQLAFEHRPLSEVAGEFNRYNHRPILIEDGDLAAQTVTGLFQANDPDSFIRFLEEIPGVKVVSAGGGAYRVTRTPRD